MIFLHLISFLRLNVPNCKEISIPSDVPAKKLKHILNNKISTGEVDIGTLAVPQIFEKTSVKNRDVVTEEVQIKGRKIKPFNTRKKMLENQK